MWEIVSGEDARHKSEHIQALLNRSRAAAIDLRHELDAQLHTGICCHRLDASALMETVATAADACFERKVDKILLDEARWSEILIRCVLDSKCLTQRSAANAPA